MAIRDRKQNFETFQGSTFKKTITWTVDSEPVDLTGYDLRMYVRNNYDSGSALLELTIGDGITVTDAEAGEFQVVITDEQTAALTVSTTGASQKVLPFSLYVYDLEYENPSGEVDKLLWGSLTVYKEVTYE